MTDPPADPARPTEPADPAALICMACSTYLECGRFPLRDHECPGWAAVKGAFLPCQCPDRRCRPKSGMGDPPQEPAVFLRPRGAKGRR